VDSKFGPLQPGDRFLKWEIRGLMGKGGHAYVYEAHDPFLSLDVAIKLIPSSRDTGRDLVARARSEARVLVRIGHPNVVKIMDAGATDDGVVYLVMEKLTGRDLRKALRQHGRLTPIEALRIAVQTAEAVAAAHAVGAIHRDLKPENVFLCPDRLVKVLDFGIAKVMGYGAPTTQKDLLHGTVLYMPPEQLKGFGVTARSDIFSLGTLLYEALHHHPALLGKTVPTVQELGWIQIERMPPLLSKIDESIPSYVARFVQRAIMKDPDQRYASMAEMAEAARAALSRLTAESGSKRIGGERDLSVGSARSSSSPAGPSDAASPTGDTELISGSIAPPPASAAPTSRTSESQLTPPPTISLISEERPGFAGHWSGDVPWRKIAIWGSAAGLGLGALYALVDSGPRTARDNGAAGAIVSAASTASGRASSPSAGARGDETAAPPSTSTAGPSSLPVPASSSLPVPAAPPLGLAPKPMTVANTKSAPRASSAAKPAPRSAMDERLDWLEKDLKGKASPGSGSPQRTRPDFPSLGVGDQQ